MADMIKFQQGELSRLAAKPITKGTLWFTTDEGAIYLDTAKGERVRFGDYITVANVNALPSAGHAYETALYYAKEENIYKMLGVGNVEEGKLYYLNQSAVRDYIMENYQ